MLSVSVVLGIRVTTNTVGASHPSTAVTARVTVCTAAATVNARGHQLLFMDYPYGAKGWVT